jgi:hypothetical protein
MKKKKKKVVVVVALAVAMVVVVVVLSISIYPVYYRNITDSNGKWLKILFHYTSVQQSYFNNIHIKKHITQHLPCASRLIPGAMSIPVCVGVVTSAMSKSLKIMQNTLLAEVKIFTVCSVYFSNHKHKPY